MFSAGGVRGPGTLPLGPLEWRRRFLDVDALVVDAGGGGLGPEDVEARGVRTEVDLGAACQRPQAVSPRNISSFRPSTALA